MGRFTLRDDGKTIAVGKVLKYKPYVKGSGAAVAAVTKQLGSTQISSSGGATIETVMDAETGEVKTKAPALASIGEEAD
jgi:hypothetical protein